MRSFLPPYGDGTEKFVNGAKNVAFSPPYGDGTAVSSLKYRVTAFSPPYGDGTEFIPERIIAKRFSPPYGENPLSHGLRRASSPERGSLVQGNGSCKSSPFRGSWRAAPERVLRG